MARRALSIAASRSSSVIVASLALSLDATEQQVAATLFAVLEEGRDANASISEMAQSSGQRRHMTFVLREIAMFLFFAGVL
mmetsp:Transcript_35207/g.75142  ORF Transcript_35207/g.75142 Transcript_35207/m.75142 type:complete len:81 (+) Transcript_35207:670-912(+)